MWNDHENVDGKFDLVTESRNCGLLLKSLKWRDHCHNESEATNNESKARLGSTRQHDKAKWQRYHRGVAALLRSSHGDTIVEQSRCVNGVSVDRGRGDDPA